MRKRLRRWWFCTFIGIHRRPAWKPLGPFECTSCGLHIYPEWYDE